MRGLLTSICSCKKGKKSIEGLPEEAQTNTKGLDDRESFPTCQHTWLPSPSPMQHRQLPPKLRIHSVRGFWIGLVPEGLC